MYVNETDVEDDINKTDEDEVNEDEDEVEVEAKTKILKWGKK